MPTARPIQQSAKTAVRRLLLTLRTSYPMNARYPFVWSTSTNDSANRRHSVSHVLMPGKGRKLENTINIEVKEQRHNLGPYSNPCSPNKHPPQSQKY